MKSFLDQEAVDKTLKRLDDAKQKKAQDLTEEQLAIMEANKKAGEEMVRKWEAGKTPFEQTSKLPFKPAEKPEEKQVEVEKE